MINVGSKYQDQMDSTRILVPTDTNGRCRVFFDGVFSGFTNVPVNLFSEQACQSRVGIEPWAPPPVESNDEGYDDE